VKTPHGPAAPAGHARRAARAQHERFLADGRRRGFYMGDGPGVGKGRQVAGIVFENFLRGRRKVPPAAPSPVRMQTTRGAPGCARAGVTLPLITSFPVTAVGEHTLFRSVPFVSEHAFSLSGTAVGEHTLFRSVPFVSEHAFSLSVTAVGEHTLFRSVPFVSEHAFSPSVTAVGECASPLGAPQAIWVSVSADLLEDARRDLLDIGAGAIKLHNLRDYKMDVPLRERKELETGIIFCTCAPRPGCTKLRMRAGAPLAAPVQGGRVKSLVGNTIEATVRGAVARRGVGISHVTTGL
jgi:hypothetical protein